MMQNGSEESYVHVDKKKQKKIRFKKIKNEDQANFKDCINVKGVERIKTYCHQHIVTI